MRRTHALWTDNAPQEWQVLPRTADRAQLMLSGGCSEQAASLEIYARAVDECNGRAVCPWTLADRPSPEQWSVTRPLPTGGPYRAETIAKEKQQAYNDGLCGDLRQHIFAGDLYLIAGQSNAAGYARDAIEDAPQLGVSVLRLNGRWDIAAHPLNDSTGAFFKNIDVPLTAHSPWLTFAKTVYRKTGVPVGLLPAALGGSPMLSWIPGGMLYENALRYVEAAGRICGVLWYQGCEDAISGQQEQYCERFFSMVNTMRRSLAAPELPFFTVQLNSFTEPAAPEQDEAWTHLRELQAAAASEPGIYLLPTAGMQLYDCIHNNAASNCTIGRQIAAQVLHALYGKQLRHEPLQVSSCKAIDGGWELTLSPVEGELQSNQTAAEYFKAYAGEKPLHIESVELKQDKICLYGEELSGATTLHYAKRRDLTGAGIWDSEGDWMLQPFAIKTGKEGNV